MTIEVTKSSAGHIRVVLTECPACGEDLDGKRPSYHLLTHHRPEDFGLEASGDAVDSQRLQMATRLLAHKCMIG